MQPGFFIFGELPQPIGEELLFGGGVTISQSEGIAGLKMDMAFEMMEDSEGFVIVQFKNNGEAVGEGNYFTGTYFFPVTGVQAMQSTTFMFEAPLGVEADQCVIGIASADVLNSDMPFAVGSFIEVDNVSFVKENSSEALTGGDFESWSFVPSLEVPKDCIVEIKATDNHFEQSTDAFAGNFAMRLNTIVVDGNIEVGTLKMAKEIDGAMVPTITIGENDTRVSFMYYHAGLNDMGSATIAFFKSEGDAFVSVHSVEIDLESNQAYDLVAYDFGEMMATDFPDAEFMTIEFKSSKASAGNIAHEGTFLLIDDVQLSSPLGLFSRFKNPTLHQVKVYPNPVQTRVTFEFGTNRAGFYRVFNGSGQQIDIKQYSSTKAIYYNMSSLPSGKYFFKFEHTTGVESARVMKL